MRVLVVSDIHGNRPALEAVHRCHEPWQRGTAEGRRSASRLRHHRRRCAETDRERRSAPDAMAEEPVIRRLGRREAPTSFHWEGSTAIAESGYPRSPRVSANSQCHAVRQCARAPPLLSKSQNISVGTPLAGVVARVFVTAGQTVRKRDPLFELDTRQLRAELRVRNEALKVAQARAAVAGARPRGSAATARFCRAGEGQARDQRRGASSTSSSTPRRIVRETDEAPRPSAVPGAAVGPRVCRGAAVQATPGRGPKGVGGGASGAGRFERRVARTLVEGVL